MTNANEHHDPNASMPSKEEIIELLREGKGITHVWKKLKEKYGNPKGTYGSHVYSVIIAHNNAIHPKQDNSINNPSDNEANDDTAPVKAKLTSESGKQDDHHGVILSEQDYIEIWMELLILRHAVELIASRVGVSFQR